MSEITKWAVGRITWQDLTVPNADQVRTFYEKVVGWASLPQDMGGYHDFNMIAPGTEDCVAGICHAQGTNAGLPAQWLMYITVEDVDASVEKCREFGGLVVAGPSAMGGGRFCVIRDPAGAVCALYQPAKWEGRGTTPS